MHYSGNPFIVTVVGGGDDKAYIMRILYCNVRTMFLIRIGVQQIMTIYTRTHDEGKERNGLPQHDTPLDKFVLEIRHVFYNIHSNKFKLYTRFDVDNSNVLTAYRIQSTTFYSKKHVLRNTVSVFETVSFRYFPRDLPNKISQPVATVIQIVRKNR